jgi:hypothetical protein
MDVFLAADHNYGTHWIKVPSSNIYVIVPPLLRSRYVYLFRGRSDTDSQQCISSREAATKDLPPSHIIVVREGSNTREFELVLVSILVLQGHK